MTMTLNGIERLLNLASDPIQPGPALAPVRLLNVSSKLVGEWVRMLDMRNGFYCFESALHVFSSRSGKSQMSLGEWNAANGWRQEYGDLDPGGLFVAEDVFGDQFVLVEKSISTFDAETGEMIEFARSVDEWAAKVVANFDEVSGFPLAHEWQCANGPLPIGQRLVPKTPFVLGGKYELRNLYACEAGAAMRARGNLAVQIKDVPDGAPVAIRVVGRPESK